MGLAVESEPGTETINAKIRDFIVGLQQIMSAETCRLTPSLIDTMHRIIAVDSLFLIIYLQKALPFITIMIKYDMNRSILFWCDAENSRMAAARQFYFQMFVRQTNCIIVGMRDFISVSEKRCPFLRSQTQLSGKGRQRKRSIILCASTNNPMTIADTLKQRVCIIIRCQTLLLCISRLRCPEILSIRSQYGWQCLTVLFRAFAKETCRLGIGWSCSHHRIQGTKLTQMFIIVHTVCYMLLHKLPIVEALHQTTEILHVGRLLIVQKLHKNLTLCISIEYHLQIRCHW